MEKFKLLLISLPFLAALGYLQWQGKNNEKPQKNVLRSKIVGKWIVGKHKQFNDADTLKIQEALDNALNGDTILLRPGRYTINSFPSKKNITLRGLSSNPEDVRIDLESTIKITGAKVTLENINLEMSSFPGPGIHVIEGELSLDNNKIKSLEGQNLVEVEGIAKVHSLNGHFIGNGRGVGIFMKKNSKLIIKNNKYIRFKNAIATDVKNFEGTIQIENLEVGHCASAGLFVSGGTVLGNNINIYNCATGMMFADSSSGQLTKLAIHSNKYFALDVLSGSQVKTSDFQANNNRDAVVHTSGENTLAELDLGFISDTTTAYIADDKSIIKAQNISRGDNVDTLKKTKRGGKVFLSNQITN